MDRNELVEVFDIETLDDFNDFEQFSMLIEDTDRVDEDMFYEVLERVEADVLVELIECYFEDIKTGVPDDCMDLYGMFSTVGISFQNRLRQLEGHSEKMLFIDELYRFRQWYMEERQVTCTDLVTNQTEIINVCEALVRYRVEQLSEGKFTYDFSDCELFSTEEYLDDYSENEEEDEDEDDVYADGLIDKDRPVIDGETYHEQCDEEDEDEYEQ